MTLIERVEQRVLGAVRLVDAATGRWIDDPMSVSSPGVRFIRNAHSAYVLAEAPGFANYSAAFSAPPAVSSAPLVITIADPSGSYLARRTSLSVPRDPDPTHADQPGSLFRALEIPMYPSPIGPIAVGAAVLRASVKSAGQPLGGALVRVVRKSDSQLLARGLSDGRGEALVPVPGIPVMTWDSSGGAVMARETDVTITAVYDPAATPPPDPDDLEARSASLKTASIDGKLASRRELAVALNVSLS